MRAELTRVIMDIDNGLDARFSELQELINNYNNKYDNIYISVGIHGLYTSSKSCIETLLK